MTYESNGCDLLVRHKVYGLIDVIEFNSVVGGYKAAIENDCIGFGDKAFGSLEAAKCYFEAFCYELEISGH